jgi:gluconate 2-dehydrogenase gamma chain
MNKLTRRTVLAGAALVPAIRISAQPPPLLEAAVDRLIPADDLGPGAKQSGVANYIASMDDKTIADGLPLLDAEARTRFSKPFVELAPADQDAVLARIETTARPFFTRLRQLTLEGMFGDPSYGGNRNFAGWDLIRYPGPRLAVSAEEQKMGVAIKPLRSSAYGNGHGH